MFASDTVPDIVFGGQALTLEQLMVYGDVEGQLLDFAPYAEDANLMPNLNGLFKELPTLKANISTPSGGIYGQVLISDYDGVGIYNKRFINNGLIEEMNMKSPETLDDFIELLYAVKEKYPDMIPLGGNYDGYNPSGILMNALGVNDAATSNIYEVGLRNGEPVVLAGDKEIFGEYLKIMKQFYDDGIIYRDFFTMDNALIDKDVEEGKVFAYVGSSKPPVGYETGQWSNIPVLTSEYSETPVLGYTNMFSIGRVYASSKTEHPELVARLVDYLYSDEGNYLFAFGPCVTQTEFLDVISDVNIGWKLSDNNSFVYQAVEDGKFAKANDLKFSYIAGGYLPYGNNNGLIQYRQELYGRETIKTDYENWLSEGNSQNAWWRIALYENYKPVATEGLPNLFFDSDTSLRINELKSVIKAYMETETVKFITGERALSELDDYIKALNEMGYEEYFGYYKDAYAAFQANMK